MRYSKFIRPLLNLIDLFVICILVFLNFNEEIKTSIGIYIYISFSWLLVSLSINFYKVYRYTSLVKIMRLIFNQLLLFGIVFLAFFGLNKSLELELFDFGKYILFLFLSIVIVKGSIHVLLKKYRTIIGRNDRQTIIVGHDHKTTLKLVNFFEERLDLGYRNHGFFSDNEQIKSLGKVDDLFEYVLINKINEIYCSINELDKNQINRIINFSENNGVQLKFIPDPSGPFSRKMDLEYYGLLPILFLRKSPLENSQNFVFKRVFDFIFSAFVILFLLSWILPLIGLFIKLESKGPVFFKQERPGINGAKFNCFKLRSMRINSDTQTAASRNDNRITNVGKFIRKTSIDELPQFLNVFLGDMSIVGPRPHPMTMSKVFSKTIDKFDFRHFVKPGITGLSQVQGNRGEIEADVDIIHRVKYDIFYIENWTFMLDIKIIVQTIINAIKGEEKAY